MSDAGGFITSWAKELNFASEKGHFFRDNAALRNFKARFRVAFNFIDAFDDDLTVAWHSGDNFTLFALIFAGEYDDSIALFYVKFNQRQCLTPSFR